MHALAPRFSSPHPTPRDRPFPCYYQHLLALRSPLLPQTGDLSRTCAYCIMLTSHWRAITVALYPGNAAQLIGAVGLAGARAAPPLCAVLAWQQFREEVAEGRAMPSPTCRPTGARSVLTAVVTLCWLCSDIDELSRSSELVS